MPYKVVLTDLMGKDSRIEEEILSPVDARIEVARDRSPEAIMEVAGDADGLLVNTGLVPRKVVDVLDKCQIIVRFGVGVDAVDVEAATQRGILVCNVPDYCMDEVSDHAMALLLACARNIVIQDRLVHKGVWNAYAPPNPVHTLRGASLGLAGFGKIPRQMVAKAQSFGLNVLAYDPYIPAKAMEEMGVRSVSMEELLAESDYISVHVPLMPDTHHLFDEKAFRAMKPNAYLINTSRGGLVDTEALVKAIEKGWIAGAGLDVLEVEHGTAGLSVDDPLLALDSLIISPHMAYYSEESLEELRRKGASRVAQVLEGYWPDSLVNPDVKERVGEDRYKER